MSIRGVGECEHVHKTECDEVKSRRVNLAVIKSHWQYFSTHTQLMLVLRASACFPWKY